jgi:CHASE2 domain-containing sensor protein
VSWRSILAGLASGLVFAALEMTGTLESFELGAYDRLFEARGPRAPGAPIVIVAIDEASIRQLTPWPFPRAVHGALIDRISAGDPIAIGIDLLFDTPSARGADDDEALGAEVTLARNVVLMGAPTTESSGFVTRFDLNIPLPIIRAGAAALAHVGTPVDSDGSMRRAMLENPAVFHCVRPVGIVLGRIAHDAGLPVAPPPREPDRLINYRGGPNTFPWLSYDQVLRGEIAPEVFRGKIVLVGVTSKRLHDLARTPFARTGDMPGVEVLANTTATVMRGNWIRELPKGLSAAAASLVGLIIGVMVAELPRWAVPGWLLGLLALAVGTYAAFAFFDTWFRALAPAGALTLGLITAIVFRGRFRPLAGVV